MGALARHMVKSRSDNENETWTRKLGGGAVCATHQHCKCRCLLSLLAEERPPPLPVPREGPKHLIAQLQSRALAAEVRSPPCSVRNVFDPVNPYVNPKVDPNIQQPHEHPVMLSSVTTLEARRIVLEANQRTLINLMNFK